MKQNNLQIKYGDKPKSMVKDLLDKAKISEEVSVDMMKSLR